MTSDSVGLRLFQIQIHRLYQARFPNPLDRGRRAELEPIGMAAVFPRLKDSLLNRGRDAGCKHARRLAHAFRGQK